MAYGRLGLAASAAGALLLASCGQASLKSAACLPAEARAWIAPAAAAARSDLAGPVDLYVDGSGSMVGYIRGAGLGERRPFQDLLAQLRAATMAGDGGEVARRYFLFGRTLRPLGAERVNTLVGEATYLCGGDAARCDNQESRLDLVLRQVAASDPKTLSVVVTDLWLSASELEASGAVAVGAPAAELLAQGRALGLIGVRAPYDGRIYDLPSGATAAFKGERPLYVLLAGPVERVAAFRANLARAGIQGFANSDAKFSLFTAEPLGADARGAPELTGAAWVRRPVLPGTVDLTQATLSTDVALRERLKSGAAASALRFTAEPGASVRDGAVWEGPVAGTSRVWRLNGDPCRPGGWTAAGETTGGWSDTGYTLFAADAAARLPKGGTYLLSGELRRTGLQAPNPANAWMRSWSFNASTEPLVLSRAPGLFPTLNLAETAQILEAAADEAARRRPVALTGFTALIRTES